LSEATQTLTNYDGGKYEYKTLAMAILILYILDSCLAKDPKDDTGTLKVYYNCQKRVGVSILVDSLILPVLATQ
jgi:hypothetical protein